MHKLTRLGFTLSFVLAMLLAAASTAFAAEDIQFLGAKFIPGKGVVFTFAVSAGFDQSQKASVTVNGIVYPLTCSEKGSSHDEMTLACIADVSRNAIGGDASITFGSATFTTALVETRPPSVVSSWCYSVIDYGSGSDAFDPPWGPIGEFCQEHTANVGDVIQFYNPNYDDDFDYHFNTDPSNATCTGGSPDFGAAYYYEC